MTNLLALGFLAVMVWRLWLHAEFLRDKGDTTMVWSVPLWPVAFAGGVRQRLPADRRSPADWSTPAGA